MGPDHFPKDHFHKKNPSPGRSRRTFLAWKTWAFVHQSGAFWSTVHVHKGSKTQMMSAHDIAADNGWQAKTQFLRVHCLGFRTLHARCSDPKAAPWPGFLPPVALLRSTRVWRPRCSGCSSSVAFGFLFLPPSAPASVAVFSTLLATTAQRAPTWECWVAEASRWNPPQHVCAGKLAPAFQSTSSSGTWTSPSPMQATIGDWRWQLAIDTTMVSPLSRTGLPHARCADVDGAATVTSPTCGPCLRSRWQVFGGMPAFLEPVVKVQGSG